MLIAQLATPSLQLSDWMAPIQGTKKISELSIPGSHDSCSLHEPFRGTAKCQDLSIPDQLLAGVRFLDIRCRHVHNAFEIYHGFVDQGISFDAVLSACLTFLQAHPSECIILSVQEESTADGVTRTFEQTFDTYLSQNKNKWFLKDYIPTLEEARGHLILFRRFNATELPKGIAAEPIKWEDNKSFWIGNYIRIQDNYMVKDEATKWVAIQNLYREVGNFGHDVLFLNFTSGYKPRALGVPNIRAVSDYINTKLTSYFQQTNPGRSGITIMDFVDPMKCALIIRTN